MATVVIVIFRIIVFLGRWTGPSSSHLISPLSDSDYHVSLYCSTKRWRNIYLNLLISHGHDLSIYLLLFSSALFLLYFIFPFLSFKTLSLIIFHFSSLLPFWRGSSWKKDKLFGLLGFDQDGRSFRLCQYGLKGKGHLLNFWSYSLHVFCSPFFIIMILYFLFWFWKGEKKTILFIILWIFQEKNFECGNYY